MMPARPSRICSRSSNAMKSSRRSFLEAGLGLPVLLGATPSLAVTSQAAETTASKDSSFDPWVEIHRENLRHNVQEISRRIASRPILAVIKNNGYGMGVANVARLLEPQPEIFGFAVVKLHEAICLRDAGIRKRILLLGPFDEKNLEDAVARSVIPMVYTPLGPALDNIAAKTQKPVPLHICVDTGIGRVGVPYYQAAPRVRRQRRRLGGHPTCWPRRWLAAHRPERSEGSHQRRFVPRDRLGLRQPLHRGNRRGIAHQNRRRCHFFRRPARLPPRGHFRSLRRLCLRPHHAPQLPPSAPLRVMDFFESGFLPSFSSFAPL